MTWQWNRKFALNKFLCQICGKVTSKRNNQTARNPPDAVQMTNTLMLSKWLFKITDCSGLKLEISLAIFSAIIFCQMGCSHSIRKSSKISRFTWWSAAVVVTVVKIWTYWAWHSKKTCYFVSEKCGHRVVSLQKRSNQSRLEAGNVTGTKNQSRIRRSKIPQLKRQCWSALQRARKTKRLFLPVDLNIHTLRED